MRLHDKVVVITGASGLLGKEHAKAVLSEGGSVALLDIQYSELTKFADSLDVEKKSKTIIF
jgi:NADP-dependent 3-hydroxy acid dehydrogenase YdfG